MKPAAPAYLHDHYTGGAIGVCYNERTIKGYVWQCQQGHQPIQRRLDWLTALASNLRLSNARPIGDVK